MVFDTYLKGIRDKENINQTQMAKILDISRTAIKLIENGSTKYPSKKVLHNLANYLNQSEIDVMAKILFTDIPLDDKSSGEYFICSYLTYMYLEGWNINDHPYIYPVWQGKSIEFEGRITKKRQPKNTMIVATYQSELYRFKKVSSKEDALGYIGDFVSKLMTVLDEFRGVILLFNGLDEYECQVFNIFKELKLNRTTFDFEIILYDSISSIVKTNKNLRD